MTDEEKYIAWRNANSRIDRHNVTDTSIGHKHIHWNNGVDRHKAYLDGLSDGRKEECFEQNNDGTIRPCEVMKENEQLKEDVLEKQDLINDYVMDNAKLEKENAELKAEKQQIQEQVKKILLDENAETGDIRKLIGMDWYDVKEIEQLKYNLKCRNDELAESKAEIKQIIERERVVPEHYLCEMIEKCKELKAQVEKMKCCANCKHKFESRKKGGYTMPCEATEYKPCDKWELAK